MKDNLSDILYILLVLLVPLLSSLTKARRKKSAEKGPQQGTAPSESRLESFLRQFEEELAPVTEEKAEAADDFIPREGMVNAEPEYQDSLLKEVMARQESYRDISPSFASQAATSADETGTAGLHNPSDQRPDTTEEAGHSDDILASLRDMDMLKRAVVYKEILDPKYRS